MRKENLENNQNVFSAVACYRQELTERGHDKPESEALKAEHKAAHIKDRLLPEIKDRITYKHVFNEIMPLPEIQIKIVSAPHQYMNDFLDHAKTPHKTPLLQYN